MLQPDPSQKIATTEEFESAISGLDNGEALLAYHKAQLNAVANEEREKGTQARHSANRENKQIRDAYKNLVSVMSQAGLVGEDVAESNSADVIKALQENLNNLKTYTPKTGDGMGTSDIVATVKGLAGELKTLRDDLKKEQEEKVKLAAEGRSRAIKSRLMTEMNGKFRGTDLLSDSLISKGRVDLESDGETVVWLENDERLPLKDGLTKLAAERKDLAILDQKPGAGSPSSGKSASAPYSVEQLQNMPPEEAAANMDKVMESMKAHGLTK